MQELTQCPRCKRDIDANHDDLGTYWHDKCHKPTSKLESYSTEELRAMMIKIYNDAKRKLNNAKLNN